MLFKKFIRRSNSFFGFKERKLSFSSNIFLYKYPKRFFSLCFDSYFFGRGFYYFSFNFIKFFYFFFNVIYQFYIDFINKKGIKILNLVSNDGKNFPLFYHILFCGLFLNRRFFFKGQFVLLESFFFFYKRFFVKDLFFFQSKIIFFKHWFYFNNLTLTKSLDFKVRSYYLLNFDLNFFFLILIGLEDVYDVELSSFSRYAFNLDNFWFETKLSLDPLLLDESRFLYGQKKDLCNFFCFNREFFLEKLLIY